MELVNDMYLWYFLNTSTQESQVCLGRGEEKKFCEISEAVGNSMLT